MVERMTDFVKKYKIKGLVFTDSNFSMDMERGRSIFKGLIAALWHINAFLLYRTLW
ncbi:hypothetical protein ACFL27_10315 [candidate division CSSED10-310 bacterium]|uniref:Uncharacterized protein n=1 Tax=candidate division CSSED10-310 bacterium TaxID=2855610 RepID=A0ABV6YWN0_UNCC1